PAADGSAKPAKARARRRRSARFAGVDDALVEPGSVLPPSGAPSATGAGTRETLTGARFAGSTAREGGEAFVPDAEGTRRAGELLGLLDRTRAEGREGEAHLLLVDAAHWPP
ncbi:hypothetical protein G3I42_27440, partial [Streptomyces sp. SID11385]|nr:hypothetical protein [Streptomyces sp. SID11385]